MDEASIRRAVSVWIKHGVLRETKFNTFVLMEEAGNESIEGDFVSAPSHSMFNARCTAEFVNPD